MKSITIKNAHFWIILAGSVVFCLWLGFGLGHDLRMLQGPFDINLEKGFQAMALNLQRATILAVQDARSAVTGLAAYIAFVVVVVSHKCLWLHCAK